MVKWALWKVASSGGLQTAGALRRYLMELHGRLGGCPSDQPLTVSGSAQILAGVPRHIREKYREVLIMHGHGRFVGHGAPAVARASTRAAAVATSATAAAPRARLHPRRAASRQDTAASSLKAAVSVMTMRRR